MYVFVIKGVRSWGSAPCSEKPAGHVIELVEIRVPLGNQRHQVVQELIDRDFRFRLAHGECADALGVRIGFDQDEVEAVELLVPIIGIASPGKQLEALVSVEER